MSWNTGGGGSSWDDGGSKAKESGGSSWNDGGPNATTFNDGPAVDAPNDHVVGDSNAGSVQGNSCFNCGQEG